MDAERISYPKLFSLQGSVAVVTGGAGLLGRQFCAGLAEHGASVAVVDKDGEGASSLADDLTRRYRVEALGVPCDVSDPASVGDMVETVSTELGPINVLHNNAASRSDDVDAFFAPTEEYDLAEWRDIMRVNLDGLFIVAQQVGRHMARNGGGSIIQTASIYGVIGPDERIYEGSEYMGRTINTPAVYAASKGGVLALTRHLATTWAMHGIRVNALTPGGVESGQNDEFRSRYSARVPMGRMAQAYEMVGALIYLASDASSYVTGHNLVVDGGLTAW